MSETMNTLDKRSHDKALIIWGKIPAFTSHTYIGVEFLFFIKRDILNGGISIIRAQKLAYVTYTQSYSSL